MCEKHCSEVCRNRKDFCGPCHAESQDDFESRIADVPTLELESMTAEELAEIEAKFKQEKDEQ